jgi:cytochrome c oxidase subunit 1
MKPKSPSFFWLFLTSGLTRGLVGQAIGYAIGFFLTAAIRQALGKEPDTEAGLTIGAFLSVIGFLTAAGVLSDWLKWIVGLPTPMRHGPPIGRPAWTRYLGVDYNHKVIGIQYAVSGVLILLIGGIFAIIFRLELAYPGIQYLPKDQYNALFSAHGIIMIASIFAGVGGMINYLVPLMIGASDMAFPRLNAFSYWVSVPAAVLILAGLAIGGWDTGWVAYPPLSVRSPLLGTQLFLIGFYINGLSSIAGGLNLIVTVATMRAPGMSLFRMPIFAWAALATSIIQFSATQTVGAALLMLIAERAANLHFFDPQFGGNPILYQHIFWFYSHPAVYVFVLPGLGIISELLPVFCRKPLFGYKWIALSSLAIALLGYLVWAHHMFTSGMEEALRVPIMFSTMLVAVPTGVKFFSWIGTMWEGKLTFPTPMLFVLGAISVFLLGGLSGPILGTIPTDLHLHDTYWVVGHFHATMFGGFVFPFFAALYYWYPKITGRMYDETLGKIHFWLMVPGFWLMSLGQMRVGLMGMRRRVVDYDLALAQDIQFTQLLVTISALIIGWSVLIMCYNLISSARSQRVAASNPWRSRSPEWQIDGPIPELNYDRPFKVVGDPYEYGLPNSKYIEMAPAAAGD